MVRGKTAGLRCDHVPVLEDFLRWVFKKRRTLVHSGRNLEAIPLRHPMGPWFLSFWRFSS